MPGNVERLRKSVGKPSAGGSGGLGGFAGPSGDPRFAKQYHELMNRGKPQIDNGHVQNLFFDDARSALTAIASGQANAANAPQIAFNLGLIDNELDTNARDAMEILKSDVEGKRARRNKDDHESLIAEAEKALGVLGATGEEIAAAKKGRKKDMSHEEWRKEVEARRERVKNDVKNGIQKLRLIPAQSTTQDAFTGNGINRPDQGAGKEIVNDVGRNKQVQHTQRVTDTWQSDNDTNPQDDGQGAPSRHAAHEKVASLQAALAQAEMEAANEDVLDVLIGKIRKANLSHRSLIDLAEKVSGMLVSSETTYLQGHSDIVAERSNASIESAVSDAEVAAYLDRQRSSP